MIGILYHYQVYDSYASRPEKGVHAPLDRAKQYTQSNKWFLKLDVRKFFASIDHETLKEQLAKRFKDYRLLAIFDQIIDSYEETNGRELPIGNLASQYFANHYLTGLDHYIKENLACKVYVRYMDDMVLWHQDKTWLKNAKREIEDFIIQKLKCQLKPILLNQVERGLPFCGYLIRPNYIRLNQRSKKRYIRKLKNLHKKYESGEWTEMECQRKVVPLIAFTRYADSNQFRQKVLFKIQGH